MRNFTVLSCTCWILIQLLTHNIFAADTFPQRNGQFIKKGQFVAECKVEIINNLVVVPARINNSDTLRFILDTGVQTSLLTKLSEGMEIELKDAHQIKVNGLGEGAPMNAWITEGNELELPGVRIHALELFVLDQDVFSLSQKLGREIHGILGYDLFENFVVEIDYDHFTLKLYDPEYFASKNKFLKGFEILPLHITNEKAYVNASIQTKEGPIGAKLLVDTGAGHALWLDIHGVHGLQLPDKVVPSYLGKGLNGDIYGYLGRIEACLLGKFALQDPTASFPDSISSALSIGLDGRRGSIGSEILKRFTVIINYSEKYLALKEGKRFDSPFHYDMSGLEISAPMPGFPIFEVIQIREGSPAALAGILPGDQIMAINGTSVSQLDMNDLHVIFQEKEGKKIKLKVFREGKNHIFTFSLASIL